MQFEGKGRWSATSRGPDTCRGGKISGGGSAGIRTRDLSIKSRLLYRLSYGPTPRLPLDAGIGRVNRA